MIREQERDPRVRRRWYAVHTRSRFEKKVAAQFVERGVEHFLPLLPQRRRWSDRETVVLMPVFPGYLFVHLSLRDRLRVLTVPGVARILCANGAPVPIPDDQIEGVRQLLAQPEQVEVDAFVHLGDAVEIVDGPFTGVRGRLLKRHGRHRLVVGVELIRQAVSVEVRAQALRRLDVSATPLRGQPKIA